MKGRSVLLLSPEFPPQFSAGVHRARHLSKHLPEFGWTPTVVTVADPGRAMGDFPFPILELTPSRVPLVNDRSIRTIPHLRHLDRRMKGRASPDVVLVTGSGYWMSNIRRMKHRFGAKVVLDFQDPWVSAHGARRPKFSKGGVAHLLARILEPPTVRRADAITSVSEEQNRQMRARYPFLADTPMEAIPIGGDPEDFQALRSASSGSVIHRLDPSCVNFCYVGTFLPRAGPLMTAMLRAAGVLAARRPDLATRLVFNFIGTSNQAGVTGEGQVMRIARRLEVAHLVRETPQRVPFPQALSLLVNADGLMMIGSDEPHYTASKVFPNLMAARPYVSLFHNRSSTHRILTDAGGGFTFAFQDTDELDNLVEPLADAMQRIADQGGTIPAPNPDSYAQFTARATASRYATLFDSLVR